MFDELHREQYTLNKFLNKALEIFKTKQFNEGHLNCLIGYEFNIYKAQQEIAKGNKVQMEVDIGDTQIDVLSNNIAYECKCKRRVNNTVVKQLKKYKRVYRDVTLFICKDTIIENETEIRKYADIERADITKQEVLGRVLRMIKGC